MCLLPPPSSSSAWRRPTLRQGHSEHTPRHALRRNKPPRTRYPPHQPYHCHRQPRFPIRCRFIVASSHPKHTNTYGVVTRHTAKFVTFAPKDCSRESIRILSKSLILAPLSATSSSPLRRGEARTQDRIALSDGAEEDQTRTQGQQEQDNIAYDALPETTNFPVSDGYVRITRTFHYLGSLINYSLHDDDDIMAQIASATVVMGALKEVWRNPHLDVYNKYLLFRAIPMNLLLWGSETWSLRKSQLRSTRVFPPL